MTVIHHNGGTLYPGLPSGVNNSLGRVARRPAHRDQMRSDIRYEVPAELGLAPTLHGGGQARPANPCSLAAFGTVVLAHPERRIGWVFGAAFIGRARRG